MHDALSDGRVLFNVACALVSFIVALQYFKFEQMAAQKAIEQKNAELEALNKTKEKLFSIIAHDLRSPIAQLKSTLDLVNRDYISKKVFSDTNLLQQLNAIIHPAVKEDFVQFQSNFTLNTIIIKESALLFETGIYKDLNYNILVIAPIDLKIERVMQRNSFSKKEIK